MGVALTYWGKDPWFTMVPNLVNPEGRGTVLYITMTLKVGTFKLDLQYRTWAQQVWIKIEQKDHPLIIECI
ncbi:hypothetical protein QYM36_007045 [Artemia franciscana]|uniref:Uncharacterized protein n=1 Tax=Artemia franciscana TaxID=6661 RepID=A0AA88HX74_ARTSF|nr:hypothetical protein QYM36_007045 [Artemia franciscana]